MRAERSHRIGVQHIASGSILSANRGYFVCFVAFSISTFAPFFQFPADRAVAAGNHFVARLNAALDLHVGVVGDARGHFDHVGLVPFLEKHHFRQLFALFLFSVAFPAARW